MSGWEAHANRSLQSLADAYQRGQIDLLEFRARRRRVLQGVRERCLQTQPNAVVPTPVAAVDRPGWFCRNRALIFIFCGTLGAGLFVLMHVLGGG